VTHGLPSWPATLQALVLIASLRLRLQHPWCFVSKYPYLMGGCMMLWSFFGTSRDKGPHDGACAIVKRFIRHNQLDPNGPKLQNAEGIVALL
jgi:hypothetical protein